MQPSDRASSTDPGRPREPLSVDDPDAAFTALQADCARCLALCCVGPAFTASADFALDKPAGQPCVHLGSDARCRIHRDLQRRGFPGCVAYDCFGAGQHVVQVTFAGRAREPAMDAVLPVVRGLHELRWYLEEVLRRAAARPVHPAAREARDAITRLATAGPDELLALDLAAYRDAVGPLLRRASALVRSGFVGTGGTPAPAVARRAHARRRPGPPRPGGSRPARLSAPRRRFARRAADRGGPARRGPACGRFPGRGRARRGRARGRTSPMRCS